nr:MAG TPA: hypothetical protein [Caudoviricetes sp.]
MMILRQHDFQVSHLLILVNRTNCALINLITKNR